MQKFIKNKTQLNLNCLFFFKKIFQNFNIKVKVCVKNTQYYKTNYKLFIFTYKGQLEVKFVEYVEYEEINKYELKNNKYFDTDKQIIFKYNLLF